jgi:hypothetical protein
MQEAPQDTKLKAEEVLKRNIENLEEAIQKFELAPEFKVTKTAEECLDAIDGSQQTFSALKTKDSHTPDFYSNAIERLAEAADIEAGIQWTINKDNNTLIRDGREGTGLKVSAYSELATAFNAARAADRMIRIQGGKIRTDEELTADEIAKITQIKEKILEVKNAIVVNPQQKIDLKAVNEFLVDVLKEDPRYKSLGDEKLYKQLNATKDIAGLEDKKYNICTIFTQYDSEGKPRTVFESEAMIPPLDDKYEEAKAEILAAQKKDFVATFEAYWGVLEAQETIPTQNLKTLPGLRNAYIKSVGEITGEGAKVFGSMMHTGTVASELETKTPNKIAEMNVRHMSEMGGALSDKGIVITTLNTPVMFGGIEKAAYDQLDAAVDKINNPNIKRGLTAMNDMKFVATSRLSAYRDALADLGSQLEKKGEHKAVAAYLQGKGSESAARGEIKDLSDPKQKKILEEAINLKSSVEPTVIGSTWRLIKQIPVLGILLSFLVKPFKMALNLFSGSKMSSSQKRTAGMAALSAMVNSEGLGKDIKMPCLSVHCKSGKDRTGAIGIDFTRRLIEAMFGHNKENLEKQINAGHVGKMAEFGGTPGCVGMKGHAGLSGEMYTEELLDKVGLKTAGNNKISQSKTTSKEIVPGVSKTISVIEVPKVNQVLPEEAINLLQNSQITTSSSNGSLETKPYTKRIEELQQQQNGNGIGAGG